MPRIDAHAHLLPDEYRRELATRGLAPYPLPEWNLELMNHFMARYDIDSAVLSLSPPGVYFSDQGLANELASMVNEKTAAIVSADAQRFAGLSVLPLPDVDAALAEIKHSLDDLHLDGVAVLSNVNGIYPGDPVWEPIFAELDRRGAYVFLHPTAPQQNLPVPGHPVWLYEFPFDTTRAVASLIFSGTLERFKNLRVQVAHLGGAAVFLADRLGELAARDPDSAAAAPAGVAAYLAGLFYDTGLSNRLAPLNAARSAIPFEQIVFGLDWPYAALPPSRDPAPALAELLPRERTALESSHIGALIPRFGPEA